MPSPQYVDDERVADGGAEPAGKPRSQNTAIGGRGMGLGLVFLVGIVLLACLGAGAVLVRGLFRT